MKLLNDPQRLQQPANPITISKDHSLPRRFRRKDLTPAWLPYLIAAVATLAVIEIDRAIGVVSLDDRPTLIPMLIPIVVSASLGGLGPGLTATAVAVLGAVFFILPPANSLKIVDASNQVAWLALIATGTLVSIFCGELHRARARAKARELQLSLLAQAESALASSLDYASTLQIVSQLGIEGSASLALLHLLAEDGSPYLAGYAHADPRLASRLADEGRFLHSNGSPGVTHTAVRTMRSACALLAPAVDDAWIAREATSKEHEQFMQELGFRSLLVVPVAACNDQLLGTLTLVLTAKSKRRYDKGDLHFAEELGRSAGRAIESARRYEREIAYRHIVEMTHDGILMLDDRQSITFANQRMVDLLGYSDASDIAGRPLADFLSADAHAASRSFVPWQQGRADTTNSASAAGTERRCGR